MRAFDIEGRGAAAWDGARNGARESIGAGPRGACAVSRRGFLALLGAALPVAALGITGCSTAGASPAGGQGSAAADASALKVVRIGLCGDAGSTDLEYSGAIAKNEGFLEEELKKAGYRPEYTAFPQAGPAINEAFAAKAVDIAQYSEFPGITARSKGIDVKAFAVSDSRQEFALLVGKDSGITDVADLKGKKVATLVGTVGQRYLLLLLQTAGLTERDVQIVNTTDGASMLASGQIDAVAHNFVNMELAAKQGAGVILTTSNKNPKLSTTSNYFVRAEYLKENRAAAVAVTRALKRAYEFARENPDKARADIVAKNRPADVVAKEFDDDTFAQFNPEITDEVLDKYRSVEQFQLDHGLIKQAVDVRDLVDTSIYEEA